MSRIKRVAGALMISAALLNIAPVASAAEPEAADCHPFPDNPVVCLVICTVQNGSVKACGVEMTCNPDISPTLCFVLGEVWGIVP